MNSSTQAKGITWSTTDDKQPIAHVHVLADMTIEELHELGRQVYSTLAEMQWSAATLLEAGARGAGHRVMHVLHKSDYEASKSCPALCGKSAEWDMVHVLEKDPRKGGICKACYELATSPELGGAHGSK